MLFIGNSWNFRWKARVDLFASQPSGSRQPKKRTIIRYPKHKWCSEGLTGPHLHLKELPSEDDLHKLVRGQWCNYGMAQCNRTHGIGGVIGNLNLESGSLRVWLTTKIQMTRSTPQPRSPSGSPRGLYRRTDSSTLSMIMAALTASTLTMDLKCTTMQPIVGAWRAWPESLPAWWLPMVPNDFQIVPDDSKIVSYESQIVPNDSWVTCKWSKMTPKAFDDTLTIKIPGSLMME